MFEFDPFVAAGLLILLLAPLLLGGIKVGIDGKAYRNTGTYGSPTWNEITIFRDLSYPMSKTRADAACRGSRYAFKGAGLKSVKLDGELLTDAAVDDYDAIRDAFINDTVLDIAIANGAIATTGTKYFRADFYVFDFSPDEPLDDTAKTPVGLELAYSSNPPGWTAVA